MNESEIAQVSPGVFATVGNTIRDGWETDASYAIADALGLYGSFGRIMQARILSAPQQLSFMNMMPRYPIETGVASPPDP